MISSLKRTLSVLLAAVLLLSASACSYYKAEAPGTAEGSIAVHFLDVGQGDSAFLELTDGRTMLIDAGVKSCGEDIVEYITNLGYSKIDYLVATHPHADHIGGMTYVVENMEIGSVYMPDVDTTTKTYENLLEAIYEKSLKIKSAKYGMYILNEADLTAKITAPVTIYDDDLNNCSVVIKLDYGDTAFLFTGDAETKELEQITGDISADVLKAGHHGSNTSTTEDFLYRVNPDYAVISCGADNEYGHPHREVLDLFDEFNVEVYRTDTDGAVIVTSDGKNIDVHTSK